MTTKMVRRKGAIHVTFVSSDSEADKEYQIARLPDGRLYCACVGCAFNHGQCRHLTAYAAAGTQSTYRERQRVIEKRKMPVEREVTYTFRRGIVFDSADIPDGRIP